MVIYIYINFNDNNEQLIQELLPHMPKDRVNWVASPVSIYIYIYLYIYLEVFSILHNQILLFSNM